MVKIEDKNQRLESGLRVVADGLTVRLECAANRAFPGKKVTARITICGGAKAIEASGIFIDLLDTEEVWLKSAPADAPHLSHNQMNETFRIGAAFALAAWETKIFEGEFQLPINFQPTFAGRFSRHEWRTRARVETSQGDVCSAFQPFRVGAGI
ncbi:MAG: hypothetical protein M3T96_00885 [Acidobacteriota bacterium]|nr:hypothetical protein [Acidobacteriota bacterium]